MLGPDASNSREKTGQETASRKYDPMNVIGRPATIDVPFSSSPSLRYS
jgi:hypothetical protein